MLENDARYTAGNAMLVDATAMAVDYPLLIDATGTICAAISIGDQAVVLLHCVLHLLQIANNSHACHAPNAASMLITCWHDNFMPKASDSALTHKCEFCCFG